MAYINSDFCKKTVSELIKIDSCQPNSNEGNIVKAILSYFPKDIEREIIDHKNGRQTLIIKINGESDSKGVSFVGHTDTVAYGDISKWTYAPLSAYENDGYIYGRGASDMKGGDTAMIATALELLSMDKKPKEPVYFCFTADEEVGGLGAVALSQAQCLKDVREFFIAEPTNEDIGLCEKGALWLRIKVFGLLSHGSRPEIGINAVEKTMEFYSRLVPMIDTSTEDKFLGKTTAAITKLNGGVMTNVIPAQAVMETDIRTLVNVDHDKVIKDANALARLMETERKGLSFEIEILNNRSAVGTDASSPFVQRITAVCKENNLKTSQKGLFFYTDASQIIPKLKVPFVILGPGDDLMAHQTDERVEIQSIVRMAKLYTEYLKKYYF